VLVCNDATAAEQVIDGLAHTPNPASHVRLIRMRGRGHAGRRELEADAAYRQAVRMVSLVA